MLVGEKCKISGAETNVVHDNGEEIMAVFGLFLRISMKPWKTTRVIKSVRYIMHSANFGIFPGLKTIFFEKEKKKNVLFVSKTLPQGGFQ